jgi:hypothetical protein
MATLVVTIRAAFDIDEAGVVEDIGDTIRSALDELRSQGAARVDSAVFDPKMTSEGFVKLGTGISRVEFELPTPTKARIEFD